MVWKDRKWRRKGNFHDKNQIFITCVGFKLLRERERSHDVRILSNCSLEMLNGRQKWRKKTGNDAKNGIFLIKATFSGFFMFFQITSPPAPNPSPPPLPHHHPLPRHHPHYPSPPPLPRHRLPYPVTINANSFREIANAFSRIPFNHRAAW